MTGASKILTVSYGTFSCTLEGFDDPFGTMKAIAVYFRDLAAEDRYFGAEPPTPDAAMLHRIAEREIQRRVEAKIQDNGVVLRASDDGDGVSAAKSKPAVAPSVLDATAPAAESVADRLSRLRSEVAQQSVATAPVISFALPEEDEGYDLPDVVSPPPEVAAVIAEDAALETDMADENQSAIAALDAEPSYPHPSVSELSPVGPAPVGPAPAEPSLSDIDTPFPEEMDDDAAPSLPEDIALADVETVDAPLPATPADTDALLAGLMADLAAPAPTAISTAPAAMDVSLGQTATPDHARTSGSDADMFAEGSDADQDDTLAAVALAQADTFDMSAFIQRDAAPQPSLRVTERAKDIAADRLDDRSDDLDDTDLSDDPTGDAQPVASLFAPVDDADDIELAQTISAATDDQPILSAETPALRPEAADRLQRARARVVRIRRVDADPADQTPAAEAFVTAPPVVGDRLTDEAEADLQAELDALRMDADPAALAPQHANASPAPTTADTRRVFDGEGADDALTRLMAQADEHLEGPESKRRLSAIAHLKAAVAATVAERKATGSPEPEQPSRLARYRDDLAMVVRNKLGVTANAQPQGERPAPLVLVSEQRIDRPRPVAVPSAPSAGVRPRRIASASGLALAENDLNDEDDVFDDAPASDSRSFAEFADRLGATTLTEQLEAAAAYLACVERREHFTRPQLMRLAQATRSEGDFAREDGLRSFGTLLRTGCLKKVRRGQFALSEASAYLTEGRRIVD